MNKQTQYTRKWRRKLVTHERWRISLQKKDTTPKQRKEFVMHDCKKCKCGDKITTNKV